MSTRRAAWLSVAWLLIGLAVAAPVLCVSGAERAVSYSAVYLVERSLSLDNVFIFLLVLDYFEVPRRSRRRVVWSGSPWPSSYGCRDRSGRPAHHDPESGPVARVIRRVLPLTRDAASGRLVTRHNGRRSVTPIGLALLALVAADITFAVDSIPAAFGSVLVFIGVRLLIEHVAAVGALASLAGIAGILGVGALVSVIADRREPPSKRALEERRPPRCPPDHVRSILGQRACALARVGDFPAA
jgi:predicted tellurium resistance membrane protein TerC